MKTSYVVIFLLFYQVSFAQVSDSFSDGDFKLNPTWQGDTSYFMVNSQKELQSQGPASSSTIYLSTKCEKLENGVWEFLVKFPFDPSTSNYSRVYICSDSANLNGSLHGYFIKIGGESGSSDGVDLYRQNGTTITKLIDGIAGHAGQSNNTIRIKVTRDDLGKWELFSDITGGNNYTPEGTTYDSTYSQNSYCGIYFTFTTTRRTQFFFDDLIVSDGPLRALNVKPIGTNQIEIEFNKIIEKTTGEKLENYFLESIGNPSSVQLDNTLKKTYLNFSKTFTTGWHNLDINNISDTSGNVMATQKLAFFFRKSLQFGDLVINEIFPDPTPSNGLPGEEFVEIFNNTSDTINLVSFKYSDASTTVSLPEYYLKPFSYVILTSVDGLSAYQNSGAVIPLNTWPSLNNGGDHLQLKDNNDQLLFEVEYSLDWYNDSDKKEGGWSLEMMNPSEYCKQARNWKASVANIGGTPGKVNSIFSASPDRKGPKLLSYELLDSDRIKLQFDEPLQIFQRGNYYILDNNLNSFNWINKETIETIWQNPFKENQETTLTLKEVKDCLGNVASDTNIIVLRPSREDSLDIIINEILFNPKPGGVDYIEIYNRSSKILDLKGWSIGSMKSDTLYDKKLICTTSSLLKPHEFRVICASAKAVESQYKVLYPERIIEIPSFPSFNDDNGTAVVITPSSIKSDRFDYQDKFHSPMLKDNEGVSLERLSIVAPTNFYGNWYSSSASAGFGTPGYENSQHNEKETAQRIEISPKVITPNGDSHHDIAFINYNLPKTGYICNVKIFNSESRLVKRLAENQMTSNQGFIPWDGTNDEGMATNSGIYILHLEFFHPNGDSISSKETVVVAYDR